MLISENDIPDDDFVSERDNQYLINLDTLDLDTNDEDVISLDDAIEEEEGEIDESFDDENSTYQEDDFIEDDEVPNEEEELLNKELEGEFEEEEPEDPAGIDVLPAAADDVHMLVDEPRDQAFSFGVDDGEVIRIPGEVDLRRDLDDLFVADQDILRPQILRGIDMGVFDQYEHGLSSVYSVSVMRENYTSIGGNGQHWYMKCPRRHSDTGDISVFLTVRWSAF